MSRGDLLCMTTPAQGNRIPDGVRVILDNGCFGKGYPGDAAWLAWLKRRAPDLAHRAVFAVAPDVVGDAAATYLRSRRFLPVIRLLGYPAAYVAQDGQEEFPPPWDEFDALFIGGSTEWKLSAAAESLAHEARRRGKWVHMGRVNSAARMRIADRFGCHSADGTTVAIAPDVYLPRVLAWGRQPTLFRLLIDEA